MSPPTATYAAEPGQTRDSAPQHGSATKAPTASRGEMISFPTKPTFSDPYEERAYLKGRLAGAFRIFGRYGYDEGVAGHITVRDPVDPETFWVNPFGVNFSLIKASDLIQVDHSGKVVDGGPVRLLNTAAFMIHSAIHKARPDVHAAAHSHSVYGRAFSALGKRLDIITQDSCAFWRDHVVYDNFSGVVLAEEEGQNIARCLGQNKAALLQNHGILTTGTTVEEAVFWFVSMEKCCQAQLAADAAGKTIVIDDEDAEFTYKTVGSQRAGWFSAKPLFDLMHKETGGEYLE